MKMSKILLAMLVALVIVATISLATLQYLEIDESKYVEIDVIKIGDNGFIFLSNENCTGIIAQASPERAQSMKLGLDNKIEFRPTTHDIFAETLKQFNITLERVVIHKLEENTYFADMILTQDNKILTLDSKPSDAIAIALRTNSTIYMNKTLFEERKEKIC